MHNKIQQYIFYSLCVDNDVIVKIRKDLRYNLTMVELREAMKYIKDKKEITKEELLTYLLMTLKQKKGQFVTLSFY